MRTGFPDPVPAAVRPCAVLGLSRVSATFSLESSRGSQTTAIAFDFPCLMPLSERDGNSRSGPINFPHMTR